MRRLAVAAIALVFSSTLFANGPGCAANQARVFVDDDISFASGLSMQKLETLKGKYGKAFLYIERSKAGYVVTDSDTLDRVRHILLPQSQLGQEQASLGMKQAALGMEQGRLGMQQIGASESEQRRLSGKQSELSKKQEELSKQQESLSAKQESLQKQSDAQIDTVLDQAIAAGLARQVK